MKIIQRMLKKLKEAFTMLNFFALFEFMGILGFILVLIYHGLQNAKVLVLPEFKTNPLYVAATMAILLFVFVIGFVSSNPKQDRLDKANMKEWVAKQEKELIKHLAKKRELELEQAKMAT